MPLVKDIFLCVTSGMHSIRSPAPVYAKLCYTKNHCVTSKSGINFQLALIAQKNLHKTGPAFSDNL